MVFLGFFFHTFLKYENALQITPFFRLQKFYIVRVGPSIYITALSHSSIRLLEVSLLMFVDSIIKYLHSLHSHLILFQKKVTDLANFMIMAFST